MGVVLSIKNTLFHFPVTQASHTRRGLCDRLCTGTELPLTAGREMKEGDRHQKPVLMLNVQLQCSSKNGGAVFVTVYLFIFLAQDLAIV